MLNKWGQLTRCEARVSLRPS